MSGELPTHVAMAHEKYISHIMFCAECYAPKNSHCLTGRTLRIEYDALYLMTIVDTRARRSWLYLEAARNPANADGLKARVIELYNEEQEKAQEVVGLGAGVANL